MKYKNFCCLVIAFCIPLFAVAQIDVSTQVQRPSVEASKITQNIEVPVNLYTGTVNIEIPIYTIKYGDISYPISLNYHGGGIKVADECGAVGLGWTLNATGVVNRIVRGFPDEMKVDNKVGYDSLKSNHKNYINLIKRHSHKVKEPLIYDSSNPEEIMVCDQTSLYGSKYDEGKLDFAQDNYIFHVHGKSGVFINNGFQKIVQSNDGCEIENDLLSYTIKSQDGYKYFFANEEKKNYKYRNFYIWELPIDPNERPEEDYMHTTSWWLSKLYSPMGDSITFDYIDANVTRTSSMTCIYSHITLAEYYDDYKRDDIHSILDCSTKTDTTYHKLISKIETPNCRISFHYEAFNGVISKFPRLDSITILSICDDAVIEKFIFSYSGTSSRAKLTNLKRIALDGEEENHTFSYRQDNISPVITPTDNRIDHWGYFASQSTGRFSYLPYVKAPDFNLSFEESEYTSRNAEHQYADNNMLTSIIYPTGRKLQLTWEPHSFSCLSHLGRTAEKEVNYDRPLEYDTILVKKYSHTLCGKEGHGSLSCSGVANAGDVIVVDLTKYYNYIKIWASHLSECVYNYNNCNISSYPLPKIIIRKNGVVKHEIIICEETTREPIEIKILETGTYNFELENPRGTLSSNTEECGYYLDIFNMSPPDESPDGYVYISINGTKIQQKNNSDLNVGGVRIKEIANYDGNTCLYKKQYEYIKDDINKISSGVLAYPHRYGSKNRFCDKISFTESFTDMDFIIHDRELLTLHSIGLPYTLGDNTHIEYSRVVESTIGKDNKKINKVVYNFATAADLGCEDLNLNKAWESAIPSNMIQLTSKRHMRGHLKSKIEYTNEILTTEYYYNIKEKANNDTITGALYTIADFTEVGLGYTEHNSAPYKNVGIIQYQVIPYNKRISKVTYNGDITNNQVRYYYENDTEYSKALNANQPIIIETIDSDNSIVRKYISYLGETDKVVSCITTKNEKVIDAYRYEYDNKNRVIKKYIALLENSSLPTKGNCSIQTLAESYVYYNNRLVEKTDHLHNISTAYLWSYNNSYIIAQIQYATFNEVKNALEESTINSLMNAYIPDMSIVNNLRSQLPDSYVTTLTYRPLIGVSSYTDERGQTMYYDYDGFGRMIESYIIENNQKKIVKHFKYKTTQ